MQFLDISGHGNFGLDILVMGFLVIDILGKDILAKVKI